MQDEDAADQVLEQRQQVGADDDGGAEGGVLADELLHGAYAARVEAGEGFIEEDGLGMVQETAADGDFLRHAAGQLRGEGVPFLDQLQALEEILGPGVPVPEPVGRRHEAEVLPDGEALEEVWVIGNVGQEELSGDGAADDVVAADQKPAMGGSEDAGHGAQRGGLAGAVGPDQAEDLARLDAKGKAGHRDGVAIRFVEIFDDDRHAWLPLLGYIDLQPQESRLASF